MILDDEALVYDIYILYCYESDLDRRFVKDFILPALEGEGCRLFFTGRDDKPGHNMYEESYRGITSCKKVIVLVTNGLLKDGMCDYALQAAITELPMECVCLMLSSEVNLAQITTQPLKTVLHASCVTHIEYNPAGSVNDQQETAYRLKYFASENDGMRCMGFMDG